MHIVLDPVRAESFAGVYNDMHRLKVSIKNILSRDLFCYIRNDKGIQRETAGAFLSRAIKSTWNWARPLLCSFSVP